MPQLFLVVRALALLLVLGALAGCGGGESSHASRTVAAAFYPLAWAAEQVGGESVEVVNLTPAGAEPHDLELSPRDVETIRDAEVVLYVGSGFQPSVEDAVAERDGVSLDLAEGDRDPHVWLDPVRFAAIAEQIGDALGRPEAGRELAQRLHALDREYAAGLGRCARRTIVTTHAAFGHLAARYGLEQVSLAGRSPEAEPGPRELERLVDEVRDSGATTVLVEPLVSSRLAETVAGEAGAEVAVLDPIEGLSEGRLAAGEDYLSVMRRNLAILEEALGCE
jgi:zinc transport system substrate-binding protein